METAEQANRDILWVKSEFKNIGVTPHPPD